MRWGLRLWVTGAVLLLLLYVARGALAPFVVAAVVAYILTPPVDSLSSRTRLPRALVVALLYSAVVGLVVALVAALRVPLVRETRALLNAGPTILTDLLSKVAGGDEIRVLGQSVTVQELATGLMSVVQESLGQPGQAIKVAEALLGAVLSVLLFLIATFYMLLDGRRIGGYLVRFVPPERRSEVVDVAGRIHRVLGHYLRGQALLIGLMATVTYICLTAIFHLHYSLPIAVASGFLEIIPFLGPVVAASIAGAVGFSQGGLQTVAGIVVLYFVLRQVEDQLVMPIVVGRTVHLHPLVTIGAVVVGESVAGVLGMLLAVPVSAAAKVVLDHLFPAPGGESLGGVRIAARATASASDVAPGSSHVGADPRRVHGLLRRGRTWATRLIGGRR